MSISVLWSLSRVFLLDVDVQRLLFDLFSCYLICFVLILENIGLAELQKGVRVWRSGEEKEKREKEKAHHFLSARFCAYLSQKHHTSKWLKRTSDLLSTKTVLFHWANNTAFWAAAPPVAQIHKFPAPGWRLQAALKEQGRMRSHPQASPVFLPGTMSHLSVFLFLHSFIYSHTVNIVTATKEMTIKWTNHSPITLRHQLFSSMFLSSPYLNVHLFYRVGFPV